MNIFHFPLEVRLMIYLETPRSPRTDQSWLCNFVTASPSVQKERAVSGPSPPATAIAGFLRQIGPNASNIHHICIPFPTFGHFQPNGARLYGAYVKNLELIRNTCTSITTLGLLVSPDCANEDPRNDLTKMIRNYGWTVKVTKLPEDDGQVYRDLQIYWSHNKRTR